MKTRSAALFLFLSLAILAPSRGADDAPIRAGSKVTLIATADGVPPPTFRWFRNGVDLGSDNPLVIPNFQAANAGTYVVRASNVAGSAESAPLVLVLSTQPPLPGPPADVVIQAVVRQ